MLAQSTTKLRRLVAVQLKSLHTRSRRNACQSLRRLFVHKNANALHRLRQHLNDAPCCFRLNVSHAPAIKVEPESIRASFNSRSRVLQIRDTANFNVRHKDLGGVKRGRGEEGKRIGVGSNIEMLFPFYPFPLLPLSPLAPS
jgi:hypothetical protein